MRVLLVLLVLAVGWVSPAFAGREDQWVHRTELGDGTPTATAVFLSWDLSSVLFKAQCDGERRELVLTYFGDGAVPVGAEPLVIADSEVEAILRTQPVTNGLEGRLSPSEPGYLVHRSPTELIIIAANEMDEPWFVGRAEPLRRVMADCASRLRPGKAGA